MYSLICSLPASFYLLLLKSFLPLSPLTQNQHSSISLQKSEGFPGIATDHHIASYSKTRHIPPLYQGWMKQPSRKKRVNSSTGITDIQSHGGKLQSWLLTLSSNRQVLWTQYKHKLQTPLYIYIESISKFSGNTSWYFYSANN